MHAFPAIPAQSDHTGATGMSVGMSFHLPTLGSGTFLASPASYLLGHLTKAAAR